MELSELKKQIKNGKLDSYYIFTGPEWEVQRIYLEQMEKIVGRKIYADSMADIMRQLRNSSFFGGNALYIVRDDKGLMNDEKLQRHIENGLLKDNVLVLLVSSVDKRTKFYKTYNSRMVSFDALETPVLRRYAGREISLSDRNMDMLIEMCENDLGRCLLEIEKIKIHMTVYPDEDADSAFERLVDNGVIYRPPYDAIFDFADAVMHRNSSLAFELYEECLGVGEATLVMLSVLYSNARALLQVQSYHGNDLAKASGLTGWQIKNAKKHLNKYNDDELMDMLQLIKKVETGIKTGRIEEQFAVPYVLVNVL